MSDRPYWCEICQRKKECYGITLKPTCFVPITNTASGTPESYLAKSLRYSRDSHEIAKTENNSEKPNNYEPRICDTCRYYNSNIPCGTTPSACKEADKFAEEFVDGLKKLKPKVEPTISKMEQVDKDINVRSKTEPTTQTKTQNSNLTFEKADEPQTEVTTDCRQTDCPWK